MGSITRSKVKIYIASVDTNPASLTSTDLIVGQIKSYAKSGGEDVVETDAVFGGYVDKEKPRTQVQLEFDIIPQMGTNADVWDALIYGVTNSVYTYNTDAANKVIAIQSQEGSNFKSWVWNNANGVSWDMDQDADDSQKGKFKFQFAPTNASGQSNFMTKALALTAMPAWTTLTS